jgi:hypothetical protein
VVNYCRAISDKAVEYLFARGLQFAVPTEFAGAASPEAARRAEELLADLVEANALGTTLLKAGQNASIFGDAFIKTYYDARRARVRVLSLDPSRCFPTWAGDDPDELVEISVISTLSAAEALARYGRSWGRTVDVVETWTEATLTITVGPDVVQDGPNPYGWIPYCHVGNLAPANSTWGISDLEDVIPLNQEIDRRLSDQSDVIAYHADPPVVFKGVRQHTDLPVGPGTVWDIPADADVALLEWHGQPPQVDTHIDRLQEALYQVAETPRTSFGDSGRLLSGVALETELQPLILRTLRKRTIWERALRQVARAALLLAEQTGRDGVGPGFYAPYRVSIVWAPMLPRDDDAEATRHINLVAAQLESHERALEQTGHLDPAHELERIVANRTQLGLLPSETPAKGSAKPSATTPADEAAREPAPGGSNPSSIAEGGR